jgi:hypothetical protein
MSVAVLVGFRSEQTRPELDNYSPGLCINETTVGLDFATNSGEQARIQTFERNIRDRQVGKTGTTVRTCNCERRIDLHLRCVSPLVCDNNCLERRVISDVPCKMIGKVLRERQSQNLTELNYRTVTTARNWYKTGVAVTVAYATGHNQY